MTGYVTSNRLQELRDGLTERDWQIIFTLARVRVATSAQLEALHFADVTRRRAQQKLAAMVGRRVLARLPRTVGGGRGGSRGDVYVLDVAGQRLASPATGRRTERPWGVGAMFLAHSLAVTEVYVSLVQAERANLLHVRRFVGEPGTWRSFLGPGGGRVMLKPDAHVVIHVTGGYDDHWFLEVDLGTERRPALSRKCAMYRSYWQSAPDDADDGVFPRVLWLVPDARRAEVLRTVIRRQPEVTAELFDVALLAKVVERMRQGAAP